ncbi:MAG: O-antigen ligase family protein [Bacteroidales bacterium]|nr:O-antigen ligase family protein [Bacteroidales bacterium]
MATSRTLWHSNIYFALLIVLVVAIPTSNFLMSAAQIFLMLNWLVEGRWKEKIVKAKNNPLLWAFGILFIVHIVWVAFSSNFDYALTDLRKKLPLLILPLVLLTSETISSKKINTILIIYSITMFVVSAYSWTNHILHPETPYRSLFPFISHIRLALNACLVIFVSSKYIIDLHNNKYKLSTGKRKTYITLLLFAVVWFVGYLLLLQSYTGFVILLATCCILGFLRLRYIKSRAIKYIFVGGTTIIVATLCSTLLYYTYNYYNLSPLSTEPLQSKTANGNPYEHLQDNFVECGNYLNNYICHTELESAWNTVSTQKLTDETLNGYPIKPTLIRYLNSKGLTKDSLGISALTAKDIKAIEMGKATVHEASTNVVPQMVYRLLFEYENYRHYHTVKNSSMLQRFELWNNSWSIFAAHPMFGVGTGDVEDQIKTKLAQNNSELKDSNMRTHNQFLTFLLTFGIIGTTIIVVAFAYAIRKQKLFSSSLFIAYFCIFMLSFLSEDTLETAAGCLFSTFFFLLFSIKKDKIIS